MSIAVILNPHARKNRSLARAVDALERELRPADAIYVTQSVDEIGPALEAALARNQHYILMHGGDGAAHWIVNAAIDRWGVEGTYERFVFVTGRGGTIDYLSHAVGTTGSPRTILRALKKTLEAGETLDLVDAPLMALRGVQHTEEGETPFLRYAWAAALAGYGANFYGPWYRDATLSGSARILSLLAEALTTAALQPVFSGGLSARKPQWLRRNEHDFLRPFEGTVAVDGELFCGDGTQPMMHFRVLHAGSVPVNLGGIVRAFPRASAEAFHVHVGDIQARVVPLALMKAGAGKDLSRPGFYDGPAQQLTITPASGHTLTPSLDGELFENVGELDVSLAGPVRLAKIRG